MGAATPPLWQGGEFAFLIRERNCEMRYLVRLDLQVTSLTRAMVGGVPSEGGRNRVVAGSETSRNRIVECCHAVRGGHSRAYACRANLESDRFARHGGSVGVSAQRGLKRNGLAGVGCNVGDGQARIEVDHQAPRPAVGSVISITGEV